MILLGIQSCGAETPPTPIPRFDIWLETPTIPIPFIHETPVVEPTLPIVKKVIFISDSLDQEKREILELLKKHIQQKGFELEEVGQLKDEILISSIFLVVAFQKSIIEPYYTKYPQIRFIYIGDEQMQEAQNLIKVPIKKTSIEKMEFLGGYIAALISDNWRAGIVSDGNEKTETAFNNGFRFFCGLCRPAYPPFVQYPIVLRGTSNNSEIVTKLQESAVKVVFLAEQTLQNQELIMQLAERNVRFISVKEPPADLKKYWIVVIRYVTLNEIIEENIDHWLSDKSDNNDLEVHPFSNANEEIFTKGKQKLAEKCYQELMLDEINPLGEY